MSDRSKSSSGIGFGGVLTIVFIVLKLTGVISWKWVWVLAPLWISWIVYAVAVIITLLSIWLEDK